MKWPNSLTLIRHAESAYNVLRAQKEASPLYQKFRAAFERDSYSSECIELAHQIKGAFSLGVSDYNTPLTDEGVRQARETGRKLSRHIPCPHVVFVSPYERTKQTFNLMALEWPALRDAKLVLDDRLREQEHGLSTLYNDWRVFHTLYPDQKEYQNRNPYWYQYPQGESVSEVRERDRSFTNMLIREHAGDDVLEVTHHLTILSKRANQERLSPEEFLYLDEHEKPVNCGVTLYRGNPKVGKDGRLELEFYNKQLWTKAQEEK